MGDRMVNRMRAHRKRADRLPSYVLSAMLVGAVLSLGARSSAWRTEGFAVSSIAPVRAARVEQVRGSIDHVGCGLEGGGSDRANDRHHVEDVAGHAKR